MNEESRPARRLPNDHPAPSIAPADVVENVPFAPALPDAVAPDRYGGSDVSGKRPFSAQPCGLEDVLAAFDELLLHARPRCDLCRARRDRRELRERRRRLAAARRPARLWEVRDRQRARGAPGVWPLSSLTPQTLLSGFERKGEPASLLLQIGEFGILAFKDLTTVLTMHREARAQIIGQLREVADGKTEKSFGNGLRVAWEGKLGLIAGVTPVIDEQHTFLAVMGERFLLYRLPEVGRRGTRSPLARTSRPRARASRAHPRRPSPTSSGSSRTAAGWSCPRASTSRLVELTDIITRARSGVARDGYSPRSALPARAGGPDAAREAVGAAGRGACSRSGVERGRDWELMRKTGWDSVPAVRCAVIHMLRRGRRAAADLRARARDRAA